MKETKPERSPDALARLVAQKYKEIPKGIKQMFWAAVVFGTIAWISSKK